MTQRYEQSGWVLVVRNWTIVGGELDLVVETDTQRRYVEVKASRTDIAPQITEKKVRSFKKVMRRHLYEYPTSKSVTLAVVFVSHSTILSEYLL